MSTFRDPVEMSLDLPDDRRAETSYPLSPTQEGMLFQSRHGGSSGLYHAQAEFDVTGDLDLEAFRGSWALVTERHAVLRTGFHDRPGGRPVQTVRAGVEVPLVHEDWRSLDEEQRSARLRELPAEDRERGFALEEAPLWRLHVARLTDTAHRVLWSFHHLLLDARSQARILREVEQAYAALTSGLPLDEPQVTPFQEYVDWWERQDVGLSEPFWREELRAAPPAAPLPFAMRPTTDEDMAAQAPPTAYGQVSLVLDGPETEALRAVGASHGLTLTTLVQGVWAFLLSRYRGAGDVVLGVTTPGRPAGLPGADDMVGLLINTLPLRTEVPPSARWADWMRGLQQKYAAVLEHEYSPLRLVQQWGGAGSGEALFDTVLTIEDERQDTQGTLLRPVREESHAGYPLSLVATHGRRLTLTLHHDTGRFTSRAVERTAGHLGRILTELVRRPDARLGELTLLTPAEYTQLVDEWNDTDTPYTRDACIHELFERRAEETPDALAVLFRDERRTYREVNEQANQVAHRLNRLGLGRGDQVVILMERSAEMIPALLGILKAGATYIPLDVNAPAKRWHWIIGSLKAACVLTQHALVPRLLDADPLPDLAHIVCVGPAPDEQTLPGGEDAPAGRPYTVHPSAGLAALPSENLPPQGTPEDIAYIIFTSGSTGTPKGVAVQHFPAVNLIEWVNRTFSVGPDDRILFITALTFDLSVYDVFGVLAAGGSIRVATGEDIREPADLLALLRDEPITFWDSAPAALMQLAPFLPTDGDGANETVSHSLRLIFMSGDWIPVHSPGLMKAAFPNVQVVGLGGATEATVWSNCFPVGTVDPSWSSIPYGKPIQNARYYVLDESLRPCPLDIPGDLYIGGDCLSSGYANEPGLTASKYLPSPFVTSPGERIYRTGDTARWREDGNLEFLGRTDSQVKIRGYRIELGEIDSTLGEHPVVHDAATVVREDASGDRTLMSYVVLHPQRARSAVQDEADALTDGRVDRWREVYDAFDPHAAKDAEDGNDFSGWNSSYTGGPIPVEEMRAWQDDTVELIRGYRPRAVLEIGCGTGLLLFPLAPECRRYYGTDFSSAALAAVRARLDSLPGLRDTVVLHQREADSLHDLELDEVDTVVVNSVVQYFPDVHYLLRVLDHALSRVADGGRIVVGDIRSLPLLEAFHADVELHHASGATTPQTLRQRVRRRMQQEEELALDPALFRDWAASTGRVVRVEIRPRGGRHRNEMSMFRYQAVLHVGPAHDRTGDGAPGPVPELDWNAHRLTPDGLRARLAGERPARLRLTGVPNARVEAAVRTLSWVKSGAGADTAEAWRAQDHPSRALDPEDVRELAAEAGYEASADWSGHGPDGSFHVLLTRSDVPPAPHEEEYVTRSGEPRESGDREPRRPESRDWSEYANQPLKAEIQQLLIPRLHTYLAERLPGYMVPAGIVALDALPVTPSGKLDRRALLLPAAPASAGPRAHVPARNTTEALLVPIWERTLSRTPVGVLDDFFELGGHSLLAVQLVARIRQVFSLEVPVRLFFELPTIAEVARELQRRQEEKQPSQPRPLTPAPRGGLLPAGSDQQRLWFIDRLSPGTTSYTVNWLVPLPPALGATVLRDALDEMIRRHETLRTSFTEEDGQVWQVVADRWETELPETDLSGVPGERAEQRARDEIRGWWDQPYDLVEGPLLRARLFRLPDARQLLAFSAHHTVFDGYSIGLFGREFLRICEALAAGEPSPLPDPVIQYADYAVWQQNRPEEEDRLAFQLDYWKERLSGAPELLTLPTDFPRPDVQTFTGDFLRRQLSPELSRQLAEVSREHQVTNYITMLSAYAVLLARHSGQDDVVIGVPIADRNRVELESMIGFLVNTVAVRVDLRGDPSFGHVLRQVRKQLFDAQSHQEVPFDRLVDALRPTRSLAHNPVFQVMFADESLPFLEHAPDQVRPEPWMHDLMAEGMSVGVARFDLTLMIQAAPEGMHVGFEYSTDLFRAETVARMADHFEVLLAAALADPGQRVRRLTMLGGTELARLLHEGTGDRNERALSSATLPSLFSERARVCPDRVAVVFGDVELSYGALERWSNRLAWLLRERGVGRECLVGLCVPRSVEMVVGLLAVLKAGAAYVPLDPAYPGERLAYMVGDAGLGVVLAGRSVAGVVPGGVPVVVLEDVWAELESCPDTAPDSDGTCDDLAYVMYTSGSTGRPKGVAVTHADVTALALDTRFARGHECVLMHSPQAFDASTYELWAPLLSGGRAVALPQGAALTSESLRELTAAHGITAVFMTTALFHLFAEEDPGCAEGLRELWTGGEPVRADAVRQVRAACPGLVVVDVYGPTETTTFATCYRMDPQDPTPEVLPIGRPLDNTRVVVLDRSLQPVPAGVAGELYIGGAGLARGYLGRPELTAEAFVADPFGSGGRLYKTGDLVRLMPGGDIEVLGRVDDQVKIRGFRVEPGEIEIALTQHPAVRGATVLVRGERSARRLVAYVVSDGKVTPGDLKSCLGERLPAYMVPAVFVLLDALPLTPNGKVDTAALAALPWEEHASPAGEFVAPRNDVEERLAQVWQDTLGTSRPVGVHDDFFALGGDSILSLQVIFRAKQCGLFFS
ncbi:amino acid adenylation domain-containing protein, partial [Streptomyces sp. NPDC001741]|uniref:amino acid adenylation domain-containing protein n=1 Tax=Streptomyces sp. NPDC001741 TaxID=3364605 RepID=UPI0036A92E4D